MAILNEHMPVLVAIFEWYFW